MYIKFRPLNAKYFDISRRKLYFITFCQNLPSFKSASECSTQIQIIVHETAKFVANPTIINKILASFSYDLAGRKDF